MRLIAIDPGFERVGIAILEKLEKNGDTLGARGPASAEASADRQKLEALMYSSCFKTSAKLPFPERVVLIGKEINRLIKKYKPDALAIETLFFTKNQKTAMAVAEARGVIIYECSRSGLEIFEYTPLQIKIAVTGYGKADKNQVFSMVKKLIKIDDSISSDDEIDAIAIGLTAFAHQKISRIV